MNIFSQDRLNSGAINPGPYPSPGAGLYCEASMTGLRGDWAFIVALLLVIWTILEVARVPW